MKRLSILTAVLLLTATSAMADTRQKGDTELSLDLSYTNVDRENRDDNDEEARVSLRYGRMLTDAHEFGGEFFYNKENDFYGTGLGVFYHYNFRAGDNLNPFLGANFVFLAGELGDIYETAYGLFAGVKVFPFEHAGFAFGTSYHWLQGKGPLADAAQVSLFGSLSVKF